MRRRTGRGATAPTSPQFWPTAAWLGPTLTVSPTVGILPRGWTNVLMRRKAAGRPRIRARLPRERVSQIPQSDPCRCAKGFPGRISPKPKQVAPGPHRLDGQRFTRVAVLDHAASRSVHDATASASDRALVAVSVAAGAATPAGRSPAGTLARLGDGIAGSAAEPGPNLLPLDPIVRPTSRRP
jgi:hypothetical protein